MSAREPLRLSSAQHDRAAGVLLGGACGDALGVPYEFAAPPPAGVLAEMTGGGLGDFAPGEWSDDTSMAVAIAEVAARDSRKQVAIPSAAPTSAARIVSGLRVQVITRPNPTSSSACGRCPGSSASCGTW